MNHEDEYLDHDDDDLDDGSRYGIEGINDAHKDTPTDDDYYDADRYDSARGWQPEDKYKKQRDAYRRKNPEVDPDDNLLEIRPANDWMKTDSARPAIAKLFGDLWLEGELAILFADTGIGKSILAMQIAESITRGVGTQAARLQTPLAASNTRLLPMTAPPQKVLYLDFELSKDQFTARYSRLLRDGRRYIDSYKFSARNIRSQIKWDGELPAAFKTLGEFMAHSITFAIVKKRAKVLIVDNISYLATSNVNANSDLTVMKALKAIKSDYGISILVLAHTPKRPIAKPLTENDLAGSKMLANFADNLFAIGKSVRSNDLRYIKHIKQRNCPAIYDASNVIVCRLEKPRNFPQFTFVELGNERSHTTRPYDNTNADRAKLIAAAHELAAAGHSQREIADRLGVTKTTVHRYLNP